MACCFTVAGVSLQAQTKVGLFHLSLSVPSACFLRTALFFPRLLDPDEGSSDKLDLSLADPERSITPSYHPK
jgi:hypothetical protein